jgi:excisionase family DNA binding protein
MSTDTGSLMTPADLAQYLAIPLPTVYQWRTKGDGPLGFRVGRHVRYRRADVDRWLDEQAAKSRPRDLAS